MEEQDWAKCAMFIWLSAYVVFFIGACVLLQKKQTVPRWLIFTGTLFLLIVNLVLLALYWEIFTLEYYPMYEDPAWSTYMDEPAYPAWQRLFYWGTALLDVFGKILAGAGMIAEGRQQIAILRYRQMQGYQPQPNLTH